MDINPEAITKVSARLALAKLSDDELAGLNIIAQTGWGDPRQLPGYGKVRHLFTLENGTKVHSLIAEAFSSEVLSRPTFRDTL